jgi:hypothetical protein
LRVYPNAYRLFNVAEPTRPPEKNNILKGDGTPEKVRGGFSILGFTRIPGEKRRGGGVDFKIATLTVQIIVLCAR